MPTTSERLWTGHGNTIVAEYPTFGAPVESRRLRRRTRVDSAKDRACRVLNVIVAALGVLITLPLLAIVALAVKMSSPGPVIYKQPRVGLDRRANRGPGSLNGRRQSDKGGRIFTIYKFRTMRTDDGSAKQVWASQDDPRITRVGRFLRASRLDELPQFFNVLMGDMNIVGPRPEQPNIFAELRDELGDYQERQRVLPGITGLAQVSLGYDTSVEDVKNKVDLDLEYIRRRSAVEDLMIMAKTMPVMVFRKGWM